MFFFQAEDGIRGVAVTGVQTCALPICWFGGVSARFATPANSIAFMGALIALLARSEERRVGKECRSRWSAQHENKKTCQQSVAELSLNPGQNRHKETQLTTKCMQRRTR